MFLINTRTVAETELPPLCIFNEEEEKIDSECWGCSCCEPAHINVDIYRVLLQFEGFMTFSLSLCTNCLDMLEKGGFSVLKNRFDLTHAKEGEYSPLAPEFIEIHITHGLSTIVTDSIRRYKIQPRFE